MTNDESALFAYILIISAFVGGYIVGDKEGSSLRAFICTEYVQHVEKADECIKWEKKENE